MPTDVPKQIDFLNRPLQEILQQNAKVYPQKTAIVCENFEFTYIKLEVLSNQFANVLAKLGVKKGVRVAIFLPNRPEFIIAFFGTLKVGGVVTAISPLYREREVEYQLIDSGAETLLALDSLYPIVEAIWDKTPLRNVILTGSAAAKKADAVSKRKVLDFGQLMEEAPQTLFKAEIDASEDLAVLQYSGGTTGTPKGAMLTHRNLVSNAVAFAAWIKGKPAQETFLTALPLFHIYGLTTSMTAPMSLAAKLILMPHFQPAKALEAIERHNVTVFCGVPTMYQTLLANPELCNHNLKSIRVCISGASSLPPQIQKQFMEVTGGLLVEGYGLTEASPVTHCSPVDATMKTVKIGSIGLPLPGTDAKIVDLETGEKTMSKGETGELAVKGPQVMKGYWHCPEESDAVLRGGWLLTGDSARMDEDGYFYITDRKKDLIKTRGYSVFPRELEDIFYEHRAVKLCAVVGKLDQRAGEIPKAYVVLKEGASASEMELKEFVNSKIANYKAIREIEFRKDLPLSAAGKVLKRTLKN